MEWVSVKEKRHNNQQPIQTPDFCEWTRLPWKLGPTQSEGWLFLEVIKRMKKPKRANASRFAYSLTQHGHHSLANRRGQAVNCFLCGERHFWKHLLVEAWGSYTETSSRHAGTLFTETQSICMSVTGDKLGRSVTFKWPAASWSDHQVTVLYVSIYVYL